MTDVLTADRVALADGESTLVRSAFSLPIAAGDQVRVVWLSAPAPTPQGVGVQVRCPNVDEVSAGLVQVHRTVAPAVVLWRDTAPPSFPIRCVEAVPGAELRFVNRWRPPGRRGDFWSSCFGMQVVELEPDRWMVRCSDEFGGFHDGDLMVELALIRGGSGGW